MKRQKLEDSLHLSESPSSLVFNEHRGQITISDFTTSIELSVCLLVCHKRRIAISDFLLREWIHYWNSSETIVDVYGAIEIILPPYILEQNSILINSKGELCIFLEPLLADSSQSFINCSSYQLTHMLEAFVNDYVRQMQIQLINLHKHWKCYDDQEYLREQMLLLGGVAFIGFVSLFLYSSLFHSISLILSLVLRVCLSLFHSLFSLSFRFFLTLSKY